MEHKEFVITSIVGDAGTEVLDTYMAGARMKIGDMITFDPSFFLGSVPKRSLRLHTWDAMGEAWWRIRVAFDVLRHGDIWMGD